MLKYLKDKKEKSKKDKKLAPPDWASERDSSFAKAWEYVEKNKNTKTRYIKSHFKVTDLSKKKYYQFSGTEICNALTIDRITLMNTSNASPHFRQYLDEVNDELARRRDKKLKEIKNSSSRGSVRSNKSELVKANTELKKRVGKLEAQKTEEIVSRVFDELPLPVKKKLGIN